MRGKIHPAMFAVRERVRCSLGSGQGTDTMSTSAGNRQSASVSPAFAASLVKSGMWLDYGFGLGQPDLFDRALAARREELTGVKIRSSLSLRARATFDADSEGKHFHAFNWHFSGYDAQAKKLIGMFVDNFKKFEGQVDEALQPRE